MLFGSQHKKGVEREDVKCLETSLHWDIHFLDYETTGLLCFKVSFCYGSKYRMLLIVKIGFSIYGFSIYTHMTFCIFLLITDPKVVCYKYSICKFSCAAGAACTLHERLWFPLRLQLLNNSDQCCVKKIGWKFSLLTDRLNVYIAAHAIVLYLNKLLGIKEYGQSLCNSSDF